MSGDLEAALAAAVGRRPDQTDGEPLALNDGDGLRAVLLRALNAREDSAERQQQSEEALHQMIRTLEK